LLRFVIRISSPRSTRESNVISSSCDRAFSDPCSTLPRTACASCPEFTLNSYPGWQDFTACETRTGPPAPRAGASGKPQSRDRRLNRPRSGGYSSTADYGKPQHADGKHAGGDLPGSDLRAGLRRGQRPWPLAGRLPRAHTFLRALGSHIAFSLRPSGNEVH
jgi:hypothetical protein